MNEKPLVIQVGRLLTLRPLSSAKWIWPHSAHVQPVCLLPQAKKFAGFRKPNPLRSRENDNQRVLHGMARDGQCLTQECDFALQAKKFAKFRERVSRVDKDVVRTDRTLPFYAGDDNANVESLRSILITYSFYNFDLGYCQVCSYSCLCPCQLSRSLLSPVLNSLGIVCCKATFARLGNRRRVLKVRIQLAEEGRTVFWALVCRHPFFRQAASI